MPFRGKLGGGNAACRARDMYILNNATHVGRNPKLRAYCVNVDSNVYDMFMSMMTAMLTLGITINAG